jgi:hypothetical protein
MQLKEVKILFFAPPLASPSFKLNVNLHFINFLEGFKQVQKIPFSFCPFFNNGM